MDAHYFEVNGLQIRRGRGFTERDFAQPLKNVILDDVAVRSMFGTQDPIGATVEICGEPFTVIGVAEARGVILLAAEQAGVKVYEYTPNEVKIAVTGYGRALKPQVMEMTRRLLKLPAVPKPDDTADALAMAICHGQATGSTLRRSMLQQTGK